jgi:hypothetical protein
MLNDWSRVSSTSLGRGLRKSEERDTIFNFL